jgi:hypothetical protein
LVQASKGVHVNCIGQWLIHECQSRRPDGRIGLTAGLLELNLDAIDLPVEAIRQARDVQRQWVVASS